jgi:hypothetical protein
VRKHGARSRDADRHYGLRRRNSQESTRRKRRKRRRWREWNESTSYATRSEKKKTTTETQQPED